MWVRRPGFSTARKDFNVDWDHLQRPGFSPDYLDRQFEQYEYAYETTDWVPTSAANALLRNNQPVLAYIAGSAEHFTAKDHDFLPGQTIEKQIIAINNSRQPVKIECEHFWQLPNPVVGKTIFTIETGEQKRVPIKVELPADLPPGSYGLKLTAHPQSGEVQTDTFAFNVLAPVQPIKSQSKIALFDPLNLTAPLLKKVGISSQNVTATSDLSGFDTLIIGKSALSPDGPAPDISRVRDGLKVIVFEQSADVLEHRLGFHVEEYGLRQVFARINDHPDVSGLTTETLANWNGQATLLPHQLSYVFDKYQTPMIEWCGLKVSHAWRCGNYGSVASVLIEKPGCGDFLPIIDGGFSLQYSPLLEYREGKGLIVFCQMDVTARTTEDPAAEHIARNVIERVEHFQPAARSTVRCMSVIRQGKPSSSKPVFPSKPTAGI